MSRRESSRRVGRSQTREAKSGSGNGFEPHVGLRLRARGCVDLGGTERDGTVFTDESVIQQAVLHRLHQSLLYGTDASDTSAVAHDLAAQPTAGCRADLRPTTIRCANR